MKQLIQSFFLLEQGEFFLNHYLAKKETRSPGPA
nr:MAG TPA: hypothetical protein [Caudoviricetes sp.]